MRIGLIVDGESEYHALPKLREKLRDVCELIGPVRCDIQPYGPVGQNALRIVQKVGILCARQIDALVVLVDSERRQLCPGDIAKDLENSIRDKLPARLHAGSISVVVKVRCFENWLIADQLALSSNRALFNVPSNYRRHVAQNAADEVDALNLLNQWCKRKGQYQKVQGAIAILEQCDPTRIGANSRSFRRFLRVVGHPSYQTQSRSPYRGGK